MCFLFPYSNLFTHFLSRLPAVKAITHQVAVLHSADRVVRVADRCVIPHTHVTDRFIVKYPSPPEPLDCCFVLSAVAVGPSRNSAAASQLWIQLTSGL